MLLKCTENRLDDQFFYPHSINKTLLDCSSYDSQSYRQHVVLCVLSPGSNTPTRVSPVTNPPTRVCKLSFKLFLSNLLHASFSHFLFSILVVTSLKTLKFFNFNSSEIKRNIKCNDWFVTTSLPQTLS